MASYVEKFFSISSFLKNSPNFLKLSHLSTFFQRSQTRSGSLFGIRNTYRNRLYLWRILQKNELNFDAYGNVVGRTNGRTDDRSTDQRPLLCLLQMRWPIVDFEAPTALKSTLHSLKNHRIFFPLQMNASLRFNELLVFLS